MASTTTLSFSIQMVFENMDLFHLILYWCDGQDVSRASQVCRLWRDMIECSQDACWKRDVHLIRLPRATDFPRTVGHVGIWERLSPIDRPIAEKLYSLLLVQVYNWSGDIHQYESEITEDLLMTIFMLCGDSFVRRDSPVNERENRLEFYVDLLREELVVCAPMCSCVTERCNTTMVDNMHDMEGFTLFKCSVLDHIKDMVNYLETYNDGLYGGLISNWKVIQFPAAKKLVLEHATLVHGRAFMSGSVLCVRISLAGLCVPKRTLIPCPRHDPSKVQVCVADYDGIEAFEWLRSFTDYLDLPEFTKDKQPTPGRVLMDRFYESSHTHHYGVYKRILLSDAESFPWHLPYKSVPYWTNTNELGEYLGIHRK